MQELGNPFLGEDDWHSRYSNWIQTEGQSRCSKLFELAEPICLLCAEKKVAECHRLYVANFLVQHGHTLVAHL